MIFNDSSLSIEMIVEKKICLKYIKNYGVVNTYTYLIKII